jgi:pimeloyl-ACP methyl ester carboxylesterase
MVDVIRYAQTVRDHVNQLLEETGKKQVCLVGWSMGGIACLYALKRLAIDPWVGHFVAFGAPFSGADLSYLAMFTGIYSKVGNQLAPGSRFLADLNRDELPEETACVSIGGRRDLICPPSTARLPGAENIVLDFAHGDFLISAELHREIALRLK